MGEPRVAEHRRVPAALWLVLGVTWLLSNLLTWRLGPVDARAWMFATGSLPFAVLAIAMAVAARIGARELVFSLFPLVLLLVLVEFGLRVYVNHFAGPQQRARLTTPWIRGAGDAQLFEPHHYSIYIPRRNLSTPEGLRHNHLGLRDDRTLPPDPRAIRIVFVGGSTTYTHDIRDNGAIFSTGLERLLNDRYRDRLGERRIEVVNAGMPGATSAENLIRLAFQISEVEPDLLVIQEGINDVLPRSAGPIQSDYGNYRKTWGPPSLFDGDESIAYSLVVRGSEQSVLGHFVLQRLHLARPWHLSRFATRARDSGDGAAWIARNDTHYFERNLRSMIAIARSMRAEVLLATSPVADRLEWTSELRLADAVAEHNAVNQRVAAAERVPCYDFAREMPTDPDLMPDGMHVSQQGSDRKRDLYFRYLVESGIVEGLLGRHVGAAAPIADGSATPP